MSKQLIMKKHLLQQLKLSMLWIPYLLWFLPMGVGKLSFYIFLILSIHEAAHIITAILCGYHLEYVRIYPFGLGAQIKNIGFGDTVKEGLIVLAGPCMHLTIIPVFLYGLYKFQWISQAFYIYLLTMSKAFFLFNILPIYPLDGGRFLQCFLHSIFPYKFAQKLTVILSVSVLGCCMYFQIFQDIGSYIVVCFLFVQLCLQWKHLSFEAFAFYRYRLSHPCKKPVCMNEKNDLYRMRYNMMRCKDGWWKEEAWIRHKLFEKGSRR